MPEAPSIVEIIEANTEKTLEVSAELPARAKKKAPAKPRKKAIPGPAKPGPIERAIPKEYPTLTAAGRPVDAIRHLARKIRDYDEQGVPVYQILFEIARDTEARNADRIHAIEVLQQRGWGKPVETVILIDDTQREDKEGLRSFELADLIQMRAALMEANTVEGEVREIATDC